MKNVLHFNNGIVTKGTHNDYTNRTRKTRLYSFTKRSMAHDRLQHDDLEYDELNVQLRFLHNIYIRKVELKLSSEREIYLEKEQNF